MDTLYPRCAGIDVHKNNVVVCIRCCDRPRKVFEEVRTFSTMTDGLLALLDWLQAAGVTMECSKRTRKRSPLCALLSGGRVIEAPRHGRTWRWTCTPKASSRCRAPCAGRPKVESM